LQYEADPRQAERLLHELDLDGKTNGCVTPGTKTSVEAIAAEKELP